MIKIVKNPGLSGLCGRFVFYTEDFGHGMYANIGPRALFGYLIAKVMGLFEKLKGR